MVKDTLKGITVFGGNKRGRRETGKRPAWIDAVCVGDLQQKLVSYVQNRKQNTEPTSLGVVYYTRSGIASRLKYSTSLVCNIYTIVRALPNEAYVG